jgi:chromate reductase
VSDKTVIRVLGIVGSLRKASFNRSLMRAAKELSPETLEISIWERLGEIPPYNEDVETAGIPEPVAAFRDAIAKADALLVATPEYNYGVPGVLKNAIDWASRPPRKSALDFKPVAIFGASRGAGGTARGQLALRQSFLFTRSPVLFDPEVLVAKADEKFDAQGNLTDEKTREYVRRLMTALDSWARRFEGFGKAKA